MEKSLIIIILFNIYQFKLILTLDKLIFYLKTSIDRLSVKFIVSWCQLDV